MKQSTLKSFPANPDQAGWLWYFIPRPLQIRLNVNNLASRKIWYRAEVGKRRQGFKTPCRLTRIGNRTFLIARNTPRAKQTLSSRPEQPAFSCARFLRAGCVVEGPWLDRSLSQLDEIIVPGAEFLPCLSQIPGSNLQTPDSRSESARVSSLCATLSTASRVQSRCARRRKPRNTRGRPLHSRA